VTSLVGGARRASTCTATTTFVQQAGTACKAGTLVHDLPLQSGSAELVSAQSWRGDSMRSCRLCAALDHRFGGTCIRAGIISVYPSGWSMRLSIGRARGLLVVLMLLAHARVAFDSP